MIISVKIDIRKPRRQPDIKTFCHLVNYIPAIFNSIFIRNSPGRNKLLLTDDVNEQAKIFKDVFIKSLEECALTVTKTIRKPFAPWMTEVQNAIQIKNNVQYKIK